LEQFIKRNKGKTKELLKKGENLNVSGFSNKFIKAHSEIGMLEHSGPLKILMKSFPEYRYALLLTGFALAAVTEMDVDIPDVRWVDKAASPTVFRRDYGDVNYVMCSGIRELHWVSRNEKFLLLMGLTHDPDFSHESYLCSRDKNSALEFVAYLKERLLEKSPRILRYDMGMFSFIDEPPYNWDQLILTPETSGIKKEAEAFFEGRYRDMYERLNIPHKRGFIFTGPPGCGKTATAKALAYETGVPFVFIGDAIHVPSFPAAYRSVKSITPCIVFIEEIDKIGYAQLSELLSTLDGFDSVEGILTIATANNAGLLDPALRCRPSRFDRVYLFPLPSSDMRKAYILKKAESLGVFDAVSGPETIEKLVRETEDFSFANLQELMIMISYRLSAGDDGDDSRENIVMSCLDTMKELFVLGKKAEKLHEGMESGRLKGDFEETLLDFRAGFRS
jgi:SpoVK/Ycf46/Vps4 family AAA+-type ATPase